MATLRAYVQLDPPRRNHAAGGKVRFLDCALDSLVRRKADGLTVTGLRGERLASTQAGEVNVTPVVRGNQIVTVRPGKRDHVETAKVSGLAVDVRLPATSKMLTFAKAAVLSKSLGLALDIEPTGGCWQDGKDGPVFVATNAELRGMRLTREPEPNVTWSVID